MWVKICGTTTLADAQLALDAGADAIGFVFAESKRKVFPGLVSEVTARLPSTAELVGVFHSQHTVAEIIAAAREAGLTAIQIHRPYDAKIVDMLRRELGPDVKLLQVITCPVEQLDESQLQTEIRAALADPELWGMLLDASRGGITGGTGHAFDWHRVAAILDAVWPDRRSAGGKKLILAGGLRPDNVHEAIDALEPWGVDVVSGVEQSPGSKSPERVKAFIEAAKQ